MSWERGHRNLQAAKLKRFVGNGATNCFQEKISLLLDEVTEVLQLDGEVHVVHHHFFRHMQHDG